MDEMRGELQEKVTEAIEFIRENAPAGEPLCVGFSGGKDSIVTKRLVELSGVPFKAYYSATGLDPAEVARFIRKHHPDVEWLRPKMTFWQGVRLKGFPTASKRWCCDILKKRPADSLPQKHRVFGTRAAESKGREAQGRVALYNGRTHLHPIFHWSDDDVWEFIRSNGLPYPSLYDEGFRRLGCVVCPFVNCGPKLRRHQKRFPGMYAVLRKALLYEWEKITPSGVPNSELLKIEGWTKELYLRYPDWPTRRDRMKNKTLEEKQRAAAYVTNRRRHGRMEKKIREAAARLRKKGKKTTVTAVAAEAGISRQALNRYYPQSKELFKGSRNGNSGG